MERFTIQISKKDIKFKKLYIKPKSDQVLLDN